MKWIDADNLDMHVRKVAEDVLVEEAQWTAHLCLQAQILPAPSSIYCTNYSRYIGHLCHQQSRQQIWVKIKLLRSNFCFQNFSYDNGSSW